MENGSGLAGGAIFRIVLQIAILVIVAILVMAGLVLVVSEITNTNEVRPYTIVLFLLILSSVGVLWILSASRSSGYVTSVVGILGLATIASIGFFLVTNFEITSNSSISVNQSITPQTNRDNDQGAARDARRLELQESEGRLVAVSEQLILEEGITSVSFELKRKNLIRINAYAEGNNSASIGDLIDTRIRLYRRHGRNRLRESIAEDDDGGAAMLSSKIEMQLGAGQYTLIVEDINFSGQSDSPRIVTIKVEEVVLSEIPRVDISLDKEPWLETSVFTGDVFDDKNTWIVALLKPRENAQPTPVDSCLVVRVDPLADEGDTYFGFFDPDTLSMIAAGDDSDQLPDGDFGEWDVIRIPQEQKEILFRVGAYSDSTEYRIHLQLASGDENDVDFCSAYRPSNTTDPLAEAISAISPNDDGSVIGVTNNQNAEGETDS